MTPLREVNLRRTTRAATTRPRELFAIGREHGQAIEAIGGGHAHGLVFAFHVGDVEFEVREALQVRGEDQILAARMEKRCPAHRAELRDLPLIAAIHVHRPHLGLIALRREATPANLRAVLVEERATIVAGHVGETLHVRAIRIGRVDVHEVLLVDLQAFSVLLAQLMVISRSIRGEDDVLAIRRIRTLRIVAARVGQVLQRLVGQRIFPDVVMLIVVPGVSALRRGEPFFELGGLQFLRCRIGVRAGEEHAFAIGMNPRAGRLANAR